MHRLERVRAIAAKEHGLAVAITARRDGSPAASVVNAGVLDHPLTGEAVVSLVARGGARKLANLRRSPRITVVLRAGWEWAAVEGHAELAGPGDVLGDLTADDVTALLRAVYGAALGGTPDQWGRTRPDHGRRGPHRGTRSARARLSARRGG